MSWHSGDRCCVLQLVIDCEAGEIIRLVASVKGQGQTLMKHVLTWHFVVFQPVLRSRSKVKLKMSFCLLAGSGACKRTSAFIRKNTVTYPKLLFSYLIFDCSIWRDIMGIKSVFITGANRGIGLEFVKQFLALPNPPTHLFATCRNPDKAEVRFIRNIWYILWRARPTLP